MELLVKTIAGSHLFGTNTDKSDHDYRGIYLQTKEQIILGEYPDSIDLSTNKSNTKNTKDDIDTVLYSPKKFLNLLKKGETLALETLFTPPELIIEQHPLWNTIVSYTDGLLHKNVKSFIGYARQQGNRYGIRGSRMGTVLKVLQFLEKQNQHLLVEEIIPDFITEGLSTLDFVKIYPELQQLDICGKKLQFKTKLQYITPVIRNIYEQFGERTRQAMKNEGIDWKALSHAVRVCIQGIELFQTGNITLPLHYSNRDVCLDIKQGKYTFQEVSEMLDTSLENLELAAKESTLPEQPNEEYYNQLLIEIHSHILFK
jgi:hypothetical protein